MLPPLVAHLRKVILGPLLLSSNVSREEESLRSVGIKKIRPLTKKAIPPTIKAMPTLSIS